MPRTTTRPAVRSRGEATRSAILTAAVKAFAEKGFEAASTRTIAEAAGIEQGLLTYHYPSKDALWRAAADRVFETLGAGVTKRMAELEGASSRERSREMIRQYVRTMAAHPEFFRFIVDQGNRPDARTRWFVDTHIRRGFEMLKQVGVLEAIGADEASTPHAFFALVGAGSLIFAVAANCRRLTGVDPRRKEAIEAHAEFVSNLLVPKAR